MLRLVARTSLLFALFALLSTAVAMAEAPGVVRDFVVVLPTEQTPPIVRDDAVVRSYTTLGQQTVLRGGQSLLDLLRRKKTHHRSLPVTTGETVLLMTTKDQALRNFKRQGVKVLVRTQGFLVLVTDQTTAMGLADLVSDFTQIEPLPENTTVLTPPRLANKTARVDFISEFIKQIDHETFKKDVQALADFKTRYTYSDGARQALDYCEKILVDCGLKVRRMTFTSAGQPRENLEAVATGFTPSQAGDVVVVGHLDSTSPQAKTLAPGADDNGSGAAGVLALARLIKGRTHRANVRFLLVLGEEQGMLGSKAYVNTLSEAEIANIRAVIVMDMIGFDRKPPVSIQLETLPFCQEMADHWADLAANYTKAATQISTHAYGSDHMPFLKKEVPTILTIESEFDDNPTYHQITDTPEKINYELCAEILKLNAAVMAEQAAIERMPRPRR